MAGDLSNYLATHYLTADPKPSKKRKRKQANEGLIIADDDETGWSRPQGRDGDNDDDDTAMSATVAGTSSEFRKAKKSGWKVLGGTTANNSTTTSQTSAQDDATRQADAIVASAAAESAAAAGDADADSVPVMMSDGTYAGLQSGAAVSAQLARRRAAERAEFERGKPHKEAETVYRDATGRRVDVSMKRAELRREAEEAARKREEAELALRGDVQIEDARRRREALDDAKVMTVARHEDDAEMNAELKAKVRWGDTMAAFVKPMGDGGGGGAGKAKSVKGRPVYKAAWTPNRYQIPPGYRWDGVDRSNGFEAERFKAINRRERNKNLDYSWQMDE
ncbi:Pre-mRNA-splicing factor of RES complex-domain-containing protein [Xylaria nigripes]|nr:Pre-mRNA-splicing factor of RES complex-domain-containing protein [Xylaria nigripes]